MSASSRGWSVAASLISRLVAADVRAPLCYHLAFFESLEACGLWHRSSGAILDFAFRLSSCNCVDHPARAALTEEAMSSRSALTDSFLKGELTHLRPDTVITDRLNRELRGTKRLAPCSRSLM